MRLLQSAEYPWLQHLLSHTEHDLAVPAIMAGRAAGRIYARVGLSEELALVTPHWGRLYLLGHPNGSACVALRELLDEVVWPTAQAAGAAVFTLAYPTEWQPYIPEVLAGKRSVQSERQYYRWSGNALPPSDVPDGFVLVAVDRWLMAEGGVANLHLLADEMASERASIDDFLANSFGIIALHSGELAGWCLSEYNMGGRCEVGIATLEPFQRRGLATAMGRHFLTMAGTHGIKEVGWHCWKRNVASAASAIRIGLDHVVDYPVHFGWYSEDEATR